MFLVRLLAVFLAVCSVTMARAQNSSQQDHKKQKDAEQRIPPDPSTRVDREREYREIFFRTLQQTRGGSFQEFGYLLFQKSVRDEIGLDEEAARLAREIGMRTRDAADRLFEKLKSTEINSEQLKAELVKVMSKSDSDLEAVLARPTVKKDRLIGLFVQHRQASAVVNKLVAAKIGLEQARREEIMAKKEAIEREIFEENSKPDSDSATKPGNRIRSWEKVQKKIDETVAEMLTAEQRKELETLKGEPFKFEEFRFPSSPPGRGPGRDGGRDRDKSRRDCDHEKSLEGEKIVDELLAKEGCE